MKNRAELVATLTDKLRTKTNSEWNEIFEGAKFPYGAVNNFREVFRDPQVVYNGMEQTIEHESVGKIKQVAPAVRFSGSKNEIR